MAVGDLNLVRTWDHNSEHAQLRFSLGRQKKGRAVVMLDLGEVEIAKFPGDYDVDEVLRGLGYKRFRPRQ